MVSRYQSNPGVEHWTTFKHILKYLLGIRDYMLVYHCNESLPFRHTDSNFQFDRNSHKSTIDFCEAIRIPDSTMEAKYVVAYEVAKNVVWLQKFLLGLVVVPLVVPFLVLFCDNSGGVA
ncbi:hypothetical protein AAG906_025132 [Vitis piasezkii]